MRSVVRSVLTRVAKTGLPGEHHFYMAFNTQAPGVTISKRLKEKYPNEMTVVLQHRFWDLIVSEERFEVKLTFDSIPERLVVPFTAVKVFFDPSVPYGLQFESRPAPRRPAVSAATKMAAMPDMATVARDDGAMPVRTCRAAPGRARRSKKPREVRKPKRRKVCRVGAARRDARRRPSKPRPDRTSRWLPPNGAKVVRLDKFRKK